MSTMATNVQVATLANLLSAERDAAVQFVAYGARDDDYSSLRASYVTTDRQLTAVRSQSAWPSPRPGDPAYLASVDEFDVALRVVRNRTLTLARDPESNITLASLLKFYVDANEFLLLSVANTMQVLRH